jgi:hypothetical protein
MWKVRISDISDSGCQEVEWGIIGFGVFLTKLDEFANKSLNYVGYDWYALEVAKFFLSVGESSPQIRA